MSPGTILTTMGREREAETAELFSAGCVMVPKFCEARFTERILAIAKQRIRDVRRALGDRKLGIGSANGFDEIVQRSPGRWDLPISPALFGTRDRDSPWWPLVAAVLGENAEHSFSGVVFSEAGSPAQYWHIDSPHVSAEHLPAHALNVLVALHDIPLEMGPTEVAVGSHVLTNHHKNASLNPDELVYQHESTTPATLVAGTDQPLPANWVDSLTAGSCLVFDDRILHRGLANRSDRARYVAYFSYRKHGYIGDTHFESQRSVFD